MAIIKTSLITPRNFIVIGIMALVSHIVLRPVYNMVDKKGSSEDE